jgi:hypothetical protein
LEVGATHEQTQWSISNFQLRPNWESAISAIEDRKSVLFGTEAGDEQSETKDDLKAAAR